MNSYPPELLVQLAPVLFVAGLDLPRPPQPQSPPPDILPQPQPQTQGDQDATLRPRRNTTAQDPFTALILRLREALTSQRKVAIWQPERNKAFQVVLVDKAVPFPPRKLPSDPQLPNSTAHSPLSPLLPSSPLYPDGLIAPIWIRKHTTLVPSVFVLFLRLYESPVTEPRSPLDLPDGEKDKEREREERKRDTELSAGVAERKKSTNERGIKLTVVLMASRRMLDDPSLDTRLTFIRRQSGLDSRAALFVLSPVSQSELHDFVRSLQQALFEPALEYYTSHSKRVRRKRNRHSQVSSSAPVIMHPIPPSGSVGGAQTAKVETIARPLRPEGWTVRYEYKMASFAEFRGEDEVALKHYQDSYATLLSMFSSTAIMPPRTKRWAEAKVLADCISIKICKLYLYNAEHALALSQHNAHTRRFAELSRGWGIGEETYEYWSWIARQYRVLGELLEQGTQSTLAIPSHIPTPPITQATPATQPQQQQQQQQQLEGMRALGLNPSTALQHPGFYFYLAAGCTERRQARFLSILDAEATQGITPSPSYLNEKKVDHLTLILELYTKSYELFKKYAPTTSQGQGRLTLWIACRIAQTYVAAGKFDLAARFFERISRTYRREQWMSMLKPLLASWYGCAQKLSDTELCVKLLLEMLAQGVSPSPDLTVENALMPILETTAPSSNNPITVDLSESEPFFDVSVVFYEPEMEIGESMPFQIHIAAHDGASSLSWLPVTELCIYYADDSPPVVMKRSSNGNQRAVKWISLGDINFDQSDEREHEQVVEGDLTWEKDGVIVLSGTISSGTPRPLKIMRLVLKLEKNGWKIEIPLDPEQRRTGVLPSPRWLSSNNPPRFIPMRRAHYSSTTVRQRPHQLRISLAHDEPAYLDEQYPISVEVTNIDDRDLDITVDVLLQPGEDDSINHISIGDESSSSLINGVSFGLLRPGVTSVKALHLLSTGTAGARVLDISVQSSCPSAVPPTPITPTPTTPGVPSQQDSTEHLRTISILTVAPFTVSHDITYRHRNARTALPGLGSLATFERDYWDDSEGGEATVMSTLECAGPWGIQIESLQFVPEDNDHVRLAKNNNLDEDDGGDFPSELLPGDQFCDLVVLGINPEVSDSSTPAETSVLAPGHHIISWRRLPAASNSEIPPPLCQTNIRLPALSPPKPTLLALLTVPPLGYLHKPLPLTLTLRNQNITQTAIIHITLEPDPQGEAFVIAGPRNVRAPTLLPGAECELKWRLIPVECGDAVRLPRLRVVHKRSRMSDADTSGDAVESQAGQNEEEVRIVDTRWDGLLSDTKMESDGKRSTNSPRPSVDVIRGGKGDSKGDDTGLRTIIVLPRGA
ncbi:hypothetical protein BD410DRAFT_647647 [Rickenella mellea]|uniref:Trafficking protein particle complex subunit 11 domain-containing protein n=1 Tax=Rickenella mellea TaxID=50990 RepID=A0A4Y7PMA0_9AGAM|nr:hypothetical protein BD410DRAFT_647647 [Rickenella mellea]